MKKYIITGSLGNISRVIVDNLVKLGKEVSVVTSNDDRVKEIESLGAKAVVGNLNDDSFLANAFKHVDVAYTMIPPLWHATNWRASQNKVADHYISAIKANGIRYVVNLSSVGAHVGKGCGPVDGLYDFEQMLNKVADLNVKHIRPAYFYHNFLSQIPMIKSAGIMGGNYGDSESLFLVHPQDIANVATEELSDLNFKGSSVRYVVGDEKKGNEIAAAIGKEIGKVLPWITFSDEQQLNGALEAGLSREIATQYSTMGNALRNGFMQDDLRNNKPQYSDIKLEDFAKEFAQIYNA